jgi:UDPglucose 6-dehydrogenase
VKENVNIRAYDPVCTKEENKIMPKLKYCKDPYDAAKGADALIIMTEWNEFRNLELDRIKKLLKEPFFFDLRNIYDPQRMKDRGFHYYCVGRA